MDPKLTAGLRGPGSNRGWNAIADAIDRREGARKMKSPPTHENQTQLPKESKPIKKKDCVVDGAFRLILHVRDKLPFTFDQATVVLRALLEHLHRRLDRDEDADS